MEKTTVEEKPVKLPLSARNPQSASAPPLNAPLPPSAPTPITGSYPPQPIMPDYPYMAQHAPVYYPGPSYPQQPSVYPAMMPANQGINPSIEYPEIPKWFRYLDNHKIRNKDGIVFSSFGDTLSDKGFFRISQLSPEYVSLEDLEGWLHINRGTAILIMQYAAQDRDAVQRGQLIIQ